jgi:hypothetical protein
LLTWAPSNYQILSTNLITVRVVDNGTPALSDSKSFKIVVRTSTLKIANRSLPAAPVTISAPANTCVVQAGGSMLVQMQGIPSSSFSVEASSDLQNWSAIGQAEADPDGVVRYIDETAQEAPARFYRLIAQ